MKGLLLVCIFMMASLLASCAVVEPGHVGIKINLQGSDRGVSDLPITTGRVFFNPIFETVLEWPTYMQNVTWTLDTADGADESITFVTKDQMTVNVDVSIGYTLDASKVPAFYVKFRSDDLAQFTHGYLRNVVRDHLVEHGGKFPIENVMGNSEAFIREVRARVQNEVTPIGVNIEQFGFIGAPRPPNAVIQAINAKTQATQDAIRIENEVRQTQAQAAKNIAFAEGQARAAIAQAQGQAEANRIKAASITPQILEWERLAASREAIGRWNGQPSTFVSGAGSTSPTSFLFQMPTTR